jgi:hypothetical protein
MTDAGGRAGIDIPNADREAEVESAEGGEVKKDDDIEGCSVTRVTTESSEPES